MQFEHSKQPTPPTYHSLPTIIPSDLKRKKEEEEEMGETKAPPLSPSPISTPTKYPELTQSLLKKMENDTCYLCHKQGHWSWYCTAQNSPNTNISPLSFSQKNNHSPPVSDIYCRCGYGFCVKKFARNERNYNRKYYACPIKRGASCKDFVKWCDEPIDESYLRPPSLKYPECQCGAGVCRRIQEKREVVFVCPIKQDHGSCGFRVLEDKLPNNTSIDTTDNDLGNDLGEGIDLLSTTKRTRGAENYEIPLPVTASESPEEKDVKSPIEAANPQHIGFPVLDDDDDAEGWEALEASLSSSQLSTPSSIQHRQSIFERDISAAHASIGIFPSIDSIVVPEHASTPNGGVAVNNVSKHDPAVNNDNKGDQLSTIMPVEASKDIISPNKSPMSKEQILRKMVLCAQRGLLSELENLDPHQHESMREAAETTFKVLDSLGIECKRFSDYIWDFINLVSSMAEIDNSMENSLTLEEHNKFLEQEKVRLAHIQNDCLKTEALFETFNQQRKLLLKEVSDLEAMLHKKQAELNFCDLETVKIETKLGDLKGSKLEVEASLKDRVRQAEIAREKSATRQAKQIAVKTLLEKAKLEIEN